MGVSNTDRDLERYFFVLYRLAELGAVGRTVKISTESLAEKIGFSQQTVSRYLIELERIGWIQRTATRDGSLIRISNLGESHLRRVHSNLKKIFEEGYPPSVTIEGKVFTGLGEGAYYVTRDVYRGQFIEKLGFDPYPGTLNLKVSREYDDKVRSELDNNAGIKIEGFKNKDRTYGDVKCFLATINGKKKCAVIRALRSHYDSSVVEVIAPVRLRDRLNLKDGSKVKLEIFLTNP